MGLGKFFRKVFSVFKTKSKEQGKPSLILAEADLWVDHKAKKLYDQNKFNDLIFHFRGKLEDKRFFLEGVLNEWEEQFKGDSPECTFTKEEQEHFVTQLRFLLDKITLSDEPSLADLRRVSYSVETTMKSKVKLIQDWKSKIQENFKPGDKPLVGKLNAIRNEFFEIELLINDFSMKMKSSKVENVLELQKIVHEIKEIMRRENELYDKLDSHKEKLNLVVSQKEEKEIDLIKLKETSSPSEHGQSALLDEESISGRMEQVEDEIFLYLVKMKKCISELEDYNSEYSLLEQVQEINGFQENFTFIFDQDKFRSLVLSLRDVEDSLISGRISEKEGSEYDFPGLLSEFREGKMRNLLEEHNILKERVKILPKERLKDDFYARVEDLDYRLKHFQKQEADYRREISRLQQSLEKSVLMKARKKVLFENLTKISFDVELELVLMLEKPGEEA